MSKVVVFDMDDTLFPEKEFVRSGFKEVDRYLQKKLSINNFFLRAWEKFSSGSRGFIFNQVLQVIESYNPEYAAIEDTYVNVNNKSSIMLAQAKAASMIAISQNDIPLVEYAAKKVKKTISGTGNADKSQIIKMIGYWLPNIVVKFSDEADALAIALCHASHYKHSEKI